MNTDNAFRMVAIPGLSIERRQDHYFDAGRTVGDYLTELGWKTDGLQARVIIDGDVIPDAVWQTMEPKPGQAVVVRRVYGNMGGGKGANQGKQIMQIIGMIGIAVAAAFTPAMLPALMPAMSGAWSGFFLSSTGAAIMSAAVGIGGSLAMSARIPKPLPRLVAR